MRLLNAGADRSIVALGGSLALIAAATLGRSVSLSDSLIGLALPVISSTTREDLQ